MSITGIKRLVLTLLGVAIAIPLMITPAIGGEKVITMGHGGEPSSLNPLGADQPAQDRFASAFEPMVYIDADAKPIPQLATSWEIVDGNRWRFHLRKGVKFHNGEDFTVEDVSFTVDWCKDPKNKCPRRGLVKKYTVKKVDDYTVDVIHNDGTVSPILPLYWFPIRIMPKDTVLKMGFDKFAQLPVGTGPFQIVEWRQGEQTVLKANENYWGGRPKIDKVIIKTIPESGARIIGLKTGKLDVITGIPPGEIGVIEKNSKLAIKKKPSLWVMHLQLRCDVPPFKDNINLRKAVAHAIDVKAITEEILGGFGEAVGGITPPSAFGYNPDLKPYKYDPDLARKFLKESGYNGEEIKVLSSNGRYFMDIDINTAVEGYLKVVGINAKLILNDWPTWIAKWSNKKIEPIHLVGWSDNTGDGVENLFDVCSSDSPYNWLPKGGIKKVNELLNIAMTNMDPKVREQAIKDADQIVHDHYYLGMCYAPVKVYGVRKGLIWSPRADETFVVTEKDDWS